MMMMMMMMTRMMVVMMMLVKVAVADRSTTGLTRQKWYEWQMQSKEQLRAGFILTTKPNANEKSSNP